MCSVGPQEPQSHPTAVRLGQDPKEESLCSPKPPHQLFISLLWMSFSSQTAAGAVGRAEDEEQEGKVCSRDLLQLNNALNKPKISLVQPVACSTFDFQEENYPSMVGSVSGLPVCDSPARSCLQGPFPLGSSFRGR